MHSYAITALSRTGRRRIGDRQMCPVLPVAIVLCVALGAAGCGTATPRATAEVSGALPTRSSPTTTCRATTPGASGSLRFTRPQLVTRRSALVAVSCASDTFCIALDDAGHAYRFDGARWTGPTILAGLTPGPGTVSVSCASADLCVAAPTGSNAVATWNGQAWPAPTVLGGASGIEAVGCAPSGYCAAVDGEGNAFALGSDGWAATSGDWGSVSAISCVSASFCVSTSGGISQWDGSAWTTPNTLGVTSAFAGVSCPTATFCLAVDGLGQALQWDGQSWSAPVRIEPATVAGGSALTGVSCPTPSFCVAVDAAGGLLQWDGATWSRTEVDGGRAIAAVSCPAPTFCVAVDRQGRALVGRAAS